MKAGSTSESYQKNNLKPSLVLENG